MANINYRSVTASVIAASDKKPGHSDRVLFAPTSTFTLIANPTGPFTNPGDTKRITANHTFPVNGGFKEFNCKARSVEPTADASGEAGGQVPLYKWKCIIKGDGPHINEFVENLLNEDIIALFNDPVCGQNNYVQAGSQCTPAEIAGFAFRGGTKSAGGFKEYEFMIQSSDKFFYSGIVTMAVENPILDSVGAVVVVSVSNTEVSLNWADTANATTYEIDYALNEAFSSGLQSTTREISAAVITSLTANTTYYVRIRATAIGYAAGPWTVVAFTTTNV